MILEGETEMRAGDADRRCGACSIADGTGWFSVDETRGLKFVDCRGKRLAL